MRTESQNTMILRYLQERGSITQAEAYSYFACSRLASRICDLRKKGHNITKVMKSGKNRYGNPCNFAEYRLEE